MVRTGPFGTVVLVAAIPCLSPSSTPALAHCSLEHLKTRENVLLRFFVFKLSPSRRELAFYPSQPKLCHRHWISMPDFFPMGSFAVLKVTPLSLSVKEIEIGNTFHKLLRTSQETPTAPKPSGLVFSSGDALSAALQTLHPLGLRTSAVTPRWTLFQGKPGASSAFAF